MRPTPVSSASEFLPFLNCRLQLPDFYLQWFAETMIYRIPAWDCAEAEEAEKSVDQHTVASIVLFLSQFARPGGYRVSRHAVATARAGMVTLGAGCSLFRRLDSLDVV